MYHRQITAWNLSLELPFLKFSIDNIKLLIRVAHYSVVGGYFEFILLAT